MRPRFLAVEKSSPRPMELSELESFLRQWQIVKERSGWRFVRSFQFGSFLSVKSREFVEPGARDSPTGKCIPRRTIGEQNIYLHTTVYVHPGYGQQTKGDGGFLEGKIGLDRGDTIRGFGNLAGECVDRLIRDE